MTVQQLIEELKTMPSESHVYIQTRENEQCALVQSIEYSDTLDDENGNENFSDGVVICSFEN